jgi:hypothetical protein
MIGKPYLKFCNGQIHIGRPKDDGAGRMNAIPTASDNMVYGGLSFDLGFSAC